MQGALRSSPSGIFVPVARLSLATPVAFLDGVAKPIPFDTVDYTKGDIGGLFNPLAGAQIAMSVGPGVYLVQFQVQVSASVTLTASCGISTTTRTEGALIKTPASTASSVSLNAVIPETDAPLLPPAIFAGVAATIIGVGAGGNITKAELLIWQLGGFG